VRDVTWSMRLVGECLEAPFFVFSQPAVDRLARDVELGRDVGAGGSRLSSPWSRCHIVVPFC
jgi:hypothetical protein